MRVTFFRFAERKSPKKGRPPVCDPIASLRGKPASERLRGAPWNSLCAGARRSDSHGESDDEAWARGRPCSPRNCPAAGAASRGWTAEHPNSRTATRAFASLGPIFRAQAPRAAQARPSAAMARMDVRLRVPFCACREAQGRVCVRVPQDTRTSCTDLPQLFERSAQRAVSSAAHTLTEHRRLPVAKRRDARSRVALSLVTFFRRSERKLLACRATPGLHPQQRHAFQTSTPRLRQAQPERVAGNRSYQNNSYRRFIDKR